MNFKIKAGSAALVAVIFLSACNKALNKFPTNDVAAVNLYNSEANYKQVLAKVYGSMALTGNIGPAGSGDVAGIDEGTSDFLRLYWMAQELSTDEAVIAWNDVGIQDFHNMNWSSSNPMLTGLYNRCFYVITLCNEFIRESTADRVGSRGLTGNDATSIAYMRAEARFVRAYQYSILMDLFANPGFVDENTPIGNNVRPTQIQRTALFTYVESELKAVDTLLPAARTNEYGRADKAAAWSLLARNYLNAQVYTGTARWTDAATYAKRVVDAGFALLTDYRALTLADNNVGNTEAIWTLNYDGLRTQSYGGTTFLVNGSVGGAMPQDTSGLSKWGGMRTTRNIPVLFPDYTGAIDKRSHFYQQNLEINLQSEFSDGFAVTKYRNRTRTGGFGSDPSRTFADIDFPVFRLAEMYLIYAEAVLRGGTGDATLALTYLNNLRTRAYGNTNGNITAGQMTLSYIIDERAREMHWEAIRRTDLIRFGRFTDAGYLWPFKGGVRSGTGVAEYRRIFPIPTTEIGSNPNIRQNPNY